MNNTYSVYVQTDSNDNIIAVNSSAFLPDVTDWTKIDEGVGDKYHHAQGNYFDKPIMTLKGIYRYRLVDGEPVEKTESEMAAEEAALPTPEPTTEEKLRADVDYLAMETGVTL